MYGKLARLLICREQHQLFSDTQDSAKIFIDYCDPLPKKLENIFQFYSIRAFLIAQVRILHLDSYL